MAKSQEPQSTVGRCCVCKGKLTDPAFPVCGKPFCYNRTVQMFEGFGRIAEVMKDQHKKGGIPEPQERNEEPADNEK